jgi:LacI family gluconate utilization system Gnt-I transcriptional repressor
MSRRSQKPVLKTQRGLTKAKKPLAARAPKSGARHPGMREIAERARVTKMTVSRALRTPSKVAPETLRRIQAAVKELGFVPNYVAGSLASKHSRIVPVIVPTLANSIFSDFIDELSITLDRVGLSPMVGCSNFDNVYEERLLLKYLGWQPSGIILTGSAHTARTSALCRGSGVPIVQTWSLPKKPFDMVVGFSNHDATYRMTKALQGWGYRHIGFCFVDTPNNDRSQQRRKGWETALREAGESPAPTRAQGAPFSLSAGGDVLRRILDRHPETDAMVCGSDALAVGVVMECRRMNIRVPQDLAITGFGDMGLASIIVPALTTVRVPGRALGRVCAEVMAQRIDGSYQGPSVVDLGFEIVRRDSA